MPDLEATILISIILATNHEFMISIDLSTDHDLDGSSGMVGPG
jgi:hypothetical protein